MWLKTISWQGRALIVLLLVVAGITLGLVTGLSYESNRRDAQELKTMRAGEDRFMRALANGREHAENEIVWRGKSHRYYKLWRERIKRDVEKEFATCEQSEPAAAPAVHLSALWVGMYNAAWMPDLDGQGDPGRAAGEVIEADTVTPTEALYNIGENAQLCGEDRKRLDELIDHLNEVEAIP